MADTSATYMGMKLKNPLIAGASSLTADMDSIRRLEDGGAAAIVTKSLFEEQVQLERFKFEEDMEKDNYRHPEMITVRPEINFSGPDEHLMWVGRAVEEVEIPVIGSLNAVNRNTWIDYAAKLEQTGIDALECNFFYTPRDVDRNAVTIEKEQMDTVRALKESVSIPISVKLSCFYSNPLHVIHGFIEAGADAVVLFNRLFEPDLDIMNEEHVYPFNFSHDTDYRLSLRYAGLLEGELDGDVCCSSGIFSGATVIKLLLAGADVVQMVSALYRYDENFIRTVMNELERWMDDKGYETLDRFRGRLSKRHSRDPWAYTRAQYAQLLMHPKAILENAPTL